MWVKKVNKIPESKWSEFNNDVRCFLDEVMSRYDKYVQVCWDGDEYASTHSVLNTLAACIRRYGYPMKVHQRFDELYIERTDI